jgi:PAS domain S-box-containing protein
MQLLGRNTRFAAGIAASLCWFFYTLRLTDRKRWLTTGRAAIFLALPVFNLAGSWTNEFHHLVWNDLIAGRAAAASLPAEPALLYWLNRYYVLSLLTLGLAILFRNRRTSTGNERKHHSFVMGSGMLPFVVCFVAIAGSLEIDFLPFAFFASGLGIAMPILLYQKIDLVPVAKEVIVEKMADPIMVLDGQNRIVDANQAAQAILGTCRADMTGAPVHKFLPAFDEHADSMEIKLEVETERGLEDRAYESYVTPVSRTGKDGKVLYLHDITTRKILEGELRRARDRFEYHVDERTFELSQSNAALIEEIKEREKQAALHKRLEARLMQTQKMEALGTLAGGIAHDFNNILWVIMGNTEMSLRRLANGGDVQTRLEEILFACQRAKSMINQILTFSRQEEQERQLVKPDSIVREAVELFRAALPADIELICDIGPECGTVMADPTQLHQLLMNLLTNAVHAMEESGGVLEVMLRPLQTNGQTASSYPELKCKKYVDLTISDTGCGMEKQTLDRIFDPFFTTKPAGKGTGMGLATVHGFVCSLGGLIDVHSEPGAGTTFRIFIPAAAE